MSSVSVVIPVRDGEQYLGEAIGSILGGTVRPDQVVVVDDGSRDGSAALAAAFGPPVTCISQQPLGLPAAVNRGVAACRGELVGFLDADDLWPETKLELQQRMLDGDPALDAVFGRIAEFVSPELSREQRAAVRVQGEPVRARLRGAMLARRTLLDRVGRFDEDIPVGDFIDWYARAEDAGVRAVLTDEVALHRRVHLSNMGRAASDPGLEYVRVARRVLQRRGGAPR